MYADYTDPSLVHVTRSDWLDAVATFLRNPLMAVFLVMLGITCLILELKMPGFVLVQFHREVLEADCRHLPELRDRIVAKSRAAA